MQKTKLDPTLIPLGERGHVLYLAETAWSADEVDDALHAARLWHVEHPADPLIPCVIRLLLNHRDRQSAEPIRIPDLPVPACA
jgi:hypothetical protein